MLSALGRVRLRRQYVTAPGTNAYPADGVLGVDGYVTRAAARMAVLAGIRDSFARAQVTLRELSGWELDDESIRQLTHTAARRLQAARAQRPDAARFAAAAGVIEAQIDAGKVNTLTGWRDVKMAVFCRRRLGAAATPEAWDERDLPRPALRAVVAAVEEAEHFARRVRQEADRLGVTTATDVTVLGDGADWIWNLAADVWPQAAGVLDVYHALEHLGGAVTAVWGEGSAAATAHTDAGRWALLRDGKPGVERWLATVFPHVPPTAATAPLLALAAYLAKHPTRLHYAARLAAGRSIGSGLVEGSIKQLVNRRLKQTGARWAVAHVGPLVELAALVDTPDWHHAWTAA